MALIGIQSGSVEQSWPAGSLTLTTVTLPNTITIPRLVGVFDEWIVGTVVGVIYTADPATGEPLALFATTDSWGVAAATPQPFEFPDPVTLPAGTYAFGFLTTQAIPTRDAVAGGQTWTVSTTEIPASFPGGVTPSGYRMPVYATYDDGAVDITKGNVYAVLGDYGVTLAQNPVTVRQAYGYAVLKDPPPALKVRQSYGYAVLQEPASVFVRQAYGYAVLDAKLLAPVIFIQA